MRQTGDEPMNTSILIQARSDPRAAEAVLSGDLGFGRYFADLMFTAEHDDARGWHDARITAFENLSLSPAAKVLHYGVEVFEGHKAYRQRNGTVALFRPELNARRLNRSAVRLALPAVPERLQLEASDTLVDAVRRWVPDEENASLYLRPTVIGTEPALGVKPSATHLYFIIASPAGPYFGGAASAISVRVEDEDVRAALGGAGFAKAGGNYGAAMMGKRRALDEGFDEVMWLDAAHRRYIEELGAMNVFVVRGSTVVTPPLSSTILDGVTRRSLLELASHLGISFDESPLDIETVLSEVESGGITEVAAVGTAAVVTPVGRIGYKHRSVVVGNGGLGPVMSRLLRALNDIQYGRARDIFGWMHEVPERQ
jgi:branched-chain amino acid aminotransferase